MMDLRLFGNNLLSLSRLMGSHNWFFKITDDVIPPWHCINTHLNAADPQNGKVCAFIESLTFDDYQLIKC